MASLKEVKTRIASVNSTRKITSAMKMVASSKLHRAQQSIESMRPYETQLGDIMKTFAAGLEGELDSPYVRRVDEVKRVALVLVTSNSSLCGGFNGNVIKAFSRKVEACRANGVSIVKVYAIGKKGADACRKMGFDGLGDYARLLDHPAYAPAAEIAAEMMQLFAKGEIDRADLVYHHFKSSAAQVLTEEEFLPLSFHAGNELKEKQAGAVLNFIVEPSVEVVLNRLIPKALHLKLYTALLDSLASEHAARVIAMQVATDNADELLNELTLTYNKTRQQAITTELLDIVGGSMS